MEKLFAYGTLKDKDIQETIFGRILTGTPDTLTGYTIQEITIEEEFGMADYVVAIASESLSDVIHGVVFNVTLADLAKVDLFESNAYKRVKVTLNSGISAWVYTEN